MRVFREPDHGHFEQDLTSFILGTVGGLAAGMLISRVLPRQTGIGEDLRARAHSVTRRLRPARLQRMAVDREELDRLEQAVLDAFRGDEVLAERGVDIGAISHGIVELSGSVFTEAEADRAVALANRIPGVRTVVNRMEVEELGRRGTTRRHLDPEEHEGTFAHQESRTGGMGRRRQGWETEPERTDDSQHHRQVARAEADRDQWIDEGFAPDHSKRNERPEVQRADRTRYAEDELDNQDPHGKHAERTLDRPPQALNPQARVGEGMKPGTELRLEHSDLSREDASRRERED